MTLEIAILAPALLLLVFGIIQFGLWSYARSLALAAAQEGVAAGRAYEARASAGHDRAAAFIAASAGDSLLDPTVTSRATVADVSVRVTGRSLSVLPGIPGPRVDQSAHAPIEEFTTP